MLSGTTGTGPLRMDFFINNAIVAISLIVIEFTLVGGFFKKSIKLKNLIPVFTGIAVSLFWSLLQIFSPSGIAIYASIIFVILMYCGFVGSPYPNQATITPQKNRVSIVEQIIYPILTSILFIFIMLQDELIEEGFIVGMIFLALLIVILLNYKRRVRFWKIFFQYIMICLVIFLWFTFLTFPYLAISDVFFYFTIGAIFSSNVFLWDNFLYQITQARQSPQFPQQSPLSPSKQDFESYQQTEPLETSTSRYICQNCDTLLEQDAIRELKAKKTVFCARCGSQVTFPDISIKGKEDLLQVHQQLLEKITSLPPRNATNSEE
jgi:DNA-directed RNA polymerase subunit RPC12/RpoP